MGSSGGSQQTPVTQTVSKDPWSGAQPYLLNQMAQAQGYLANNVGYNPIMPTQAGLDPTFLSGYGNAASIAALGPGGMPSTLNSLNMANQMLTQGGLAPGQTTAINNLNQLAATAAGDENPYLQQVINQQMNQANSAMSGSGRYGSGAHSAAIAQAIAPTLAQDYARRQQLQQQLYGQVSDIYGQGLQNAGRWAQLAPTLEQARYMPAQMQMGLGQYMTDRAQAYLNDVQKYNNAWQAYPWEQLARANAITQGAGALGGTQISSSPITQPSTMQRILGGGLAGAGLGGSLFGAPGAAVGAAGGGLLGLLG